MAIHDRRRPDLDRNRDIFDNEVLEEMLLQLKLLNKQLEFLTELKISREEIE